METWELLALIGALLAAVGGMWGMVFQVTRSNVEAVRKGWEQRAEGERQATAAFLQSNVEGLDALRREVEAHANNTSNQLESLDKGMTKRIDALAQGMNDRMEALDRDMASRFESATAKIALLDRDMTTQFTAVNGKVGALQRYVDLRIEAQTAEQSHQKERMETALARMRLMAETFTAAGTALTVDE